jgi:methionyl-tRNA formyltransferase
MNIIFFTQDDPFYIKVFFEEFFHISESLNEIKAIVISQPMGKKSILKLARQMYNFYSFVDFIRMGVRFSFIKLMSKKIIDKSTRGKNQKTYSIKQLAELYSVPVIERSDLNSKDCCDLLKQFNPDLFISIASPIIFKEDLINIPKLDCINIHNSPLPKYRGMLPNFWQLYHGEKEAGITVHKIDIGIDTGDIIRQHFIPIEPFDTLNNLIIKTKKIDALIINEVIEDFRQGKVRYKRMGGDGSYFTFPTQKDVREFKKRGKKII